MGAGSSAIRGKAAWRAHLRSRTLTLAEIAWLCAVPCALATWLAVSVLGPLLGHAFLEPGDEVVFPGVGLVPEPAEHGRFFVAMGGPVLFAAAIALARRWPARLPVPLTWLLVTIVQWAAVAFAFVTLVASYGTFLGVRMPQASGSGLFFYPATLIKAASFAVLLSVALRLRPVVAHVARWTRETPVRSIVCAVIATGYSADWLLRAINSDATIGKTGILNLVPWELSEPFAILNGHATLADFHAMYSQLWSYLSAGTMVLAGASITTWTVTMATVSCLAVLAIFALLRRITDSSLLALALYLPFLSISFWFQGPPATGTSIASIFSIWPLRYGGPYILAWLVTRHLDGVGPRRTWILFAVAGLVLINNLEFGSAAFAATVVAVAITSLGRWRRLLLSIASGLAVSVLGVSALTLAQAGELPHFGLMLEFPHLFGIEGWGLQSMPTIGPHLTMYVTFAAAIGVAVVRALRHEPDVALTGMLGWSGAFGPLAGTYFLGRSEPGVLLCLFSAWSLALALLLIVIVRSIAARARWPTLPELSVMFGFGLALACLHSTPTPWAQVARLRDPASTQIYKQRGTTHFVAERTTRGERVAIFAPLGFRIAYDLGLDNVSPYVSLEAIRTRKQLHTAVDAVERAHVHRIFMKTAQVGEESGNLPAVTRAFTAIGFAPVASEALLVELSDR